ncbi:MAG: rhomboid family intramembrane serine protease [bacterium]
MKAELQNIFNQQKKSVTFTLIVLSSIVFIITSGIRLFNSSAAHEINEIFGLSATGMFSDFYIHQLITNEFLHANFYHLLVNMLSLWMIGFLVEQRMGKEKYIYLLITSMLFGDGAFLLFNKNNNLISLGMSDIIYGILVAAAVFFPQHKLQVFEIFPMRLKYAVIIMGLMELYLSFATPGPGIIHLSNVGGALGALIYLKSHSLFSKISSSIKAKHHSATVIQKSNSIRTNPNTNDSREIEIVTKAMQFGIKALSKEELQIYKNRMKRLGKTHTQGSKSSP